MMQSDTRKNPFPVISKTICKDFHFFDGGFTDISGLAVGDILSNQFFINNLNQETLDSGQG